MTKPSEKDLGRPSNKNRTMLVRLAVCLADFTNNEALAEAEKIITDFAAAEFEAGLRARMPSREEFKQQALKVSQPNANGSYLDRDSFLEGAQWLAANMRKDEK